MSFSHAPWQYDWKRPLWQQASPVNDSDATTPSNRSSLVAIQHVAAAILPHETRDCIQKRELASSSSSSLILTVTLSKSSSAHSFADVLEMDIIFHPQSEEDPASSTGSTVNRSCTPSPKILESRQFRWPSSTMETVAAVDDDDDQMMDPSLDLNRPRSEQISCFPRFAQHHPDEEQEEDDTNDSSSSSPPVPCFYDLTKNPIFRMLFLQKDRRGARRNVSTMLPQPRRAQGGGLVAAALVRLPPPKKAIDHQTIWSSGRDEHWTVSSSSKADEYDQEESPTTELILAVLSNENKVHFYSPWKLMESRDQKKKHSSEKYNELEEGMASFVFGSWLLSNIQDTILPLSQPQRTLRLSVPSLLQSPQRENTVVLGKNPPTSSSPTTTKGRGGGIMSFLDASLWDPNLDPASLPYQTVGNVPTHCVEAIEFLCIAGRGRLRWNTTTTRTNDDTSSSILFDDPTGTLETTAPPTLASKVRGDSEGGFLTFISLRQYIESRTLFLPFPPRQVSSFRWGPMAFLLVIGTSSTNAVAIRVDSNSEITTVPGGRPPSCLLESINHHDDSGTRPALETFQDVVDVPHFQILPILLPSDMDGSTILLAGSDALVSPPGVVLLKSSGSTAIIKHYTLGSINVVPKADVPLFSQYQTGSEQIPVMTTEFQPGHATEIINALDPLETAFHAWCYLGQGFSFVQLRSSVYFVCLEGANPDRGAYYHELATDTRREFNRCVITRVLALNPFSKVPFGSGSHLDDGLMSRTLEKQLISSGDSMVENHPEREELDEIVVEAIESISTLSYRENISGQSPLSIRRNKSITLTNREKSVRLLRHCTSWTKLENATRHRFTTQISVLSARMAENANERYILSLRKVVVDNGPTVPFPEVLSWLSERKDFFTASSLALDLLRDAVSLRHLWKNFNKIEDEEERSRLEGLLDGVEPIQTTGKNSTRTQLADMTVGCLVKGGHSMSSTLEHFLGSNIDYDPSRASLMLVATVASALSDDDALVSSVMGDDYKKTRCHPEKLMWPVRCLLKIGVARDRLLTVLVLLNTTIPDELRHRQRSGAASSSVPSMEMCKLLVSLIVGSSPDAVEMLLDFVDEKSRSRYWQSLDRETQLELALLEVNGKHPLLRDPEVRFWLIGKLQMLVEHADSGFSASSLPTQWLQALVVAILMNAGCHLDKLLKLTDESEMKCNVEQGSLEEYTYNIRRVRGILCPRPGFGGLDFDLLIPAMLVLEYRGIPWNVDAETTTRLVLNSICYHAGRPTFEEPLFPMNSATLMQQCTFVGDVEAGANLIGGKNGVILECCHVLIEELGMEMDAAESFLSSRHEFSFEALSSSEATSFSLRSCHYRILWLLEEHVLSIRTYGEFNGTHSRGQIDPVFAARIGLKTWWAITRDYLSSATDWLTGWLRHHLSITNRTSVSPNRLACAALVRALLWPDPLDGGGPCANLLAGQLEMDILFLIQISRGCCGLVEALPNSQIESLWKMMDVDSATRFPASSSKTGTTTSFMDYTLEESFVSAAASLGEIESSQQSDDNE